MKQSSQLSSLSSARILDAVVPTRLSSLNGHAPHGLVRQFGPGALLFLEGDECSGVFVLRSGRVKLSVSQPGGKSVIVGIAEPGDIVGLAAVVDGSPYEATAEAIETCNTEFVRRDEVLSALTAEAGLAQYAVRQLSRGYLQMCETVVSLSASDPVIVRLARLVVSWMPRGNGHHPVKLDNHFTHQQIAEMIGTTRETVTRSLSEMRDRGLVTLKNGELAVHDNERLRFLAGNGTNGNGL
jgi:CRP/FNR family transcriptional regulator